MLTLQNPGVTKLSHRMGPPWGEPVPRHSIPWPTTPPTSRRRPPRPLRATWASSSPSTSKTRCAARISTTRCPSSSGARCPTCATASSPCTAASSTRCTTWATTTTAPTRSARAWSATSSVSTTRTATPSVYDAMVRLAQPWIAALPARRRAGQLRLGRRRFARRHALHRSAHGPAGRGAAGGHRQGDRRLRAQLRRLADRAAGAPHALPEPAGQRQHGHRGGHGHQHPAAQPGRGDRRHAAPHRPPQGHRRGI